MDLSRQPILEEIYRCMEADPTIVLIGEGARLKASLDYPPLLKKFSSRIFTGPIAEAGMVNMGLGAAITGMRPIVDVIFNDLLLRVMDEILNEVSKIHVMSGGKLHARLVIKAEFTKFENAQSGSRYDYLFEHIPPPLKYGKDPRLAPELRVSIPKSVKESVDMMREALHYNGPTLYFEDRLIEK
jgi:acetoin:2,6-dichlorophenolindophenol oxidoreductase subunit beta